MPSIPIFSHAYSAISNFHSPAHSPTPPLPHSPIPPLHHSTTPPFPHRFISQIAISCKMSLFKSYSWAVENAGNTDVVTIDARPEATYLYGHIPNSYTLSLERVIEIGLYGDHLAPPKQHAADVFGGLGIDDTKMVVVAGDAMDPAAARIAWTLKYFGHDQTFLMEDSGNLWRNGPELTKKHSTGRPARFTPVINYDIRADAKDILNNKKVTLIDARSPQEFMGGHLPGALSIPFTMGLGGRLFQDGSRLSAMFRAQGVEPTDDIVCYCTHGHRASSLYFQLHAAGFESVSLYDGSFVDWTGRGLPLE